MEAYRYNALSAARPEACHNACTMTLSVTADMTESGFEGAARPLDLITDGLRKIRATIGASHRQCCTACVDMIDSADVLRAALCK